jgi:tRNA (cmo5U34)-methyltransferase
LKTKPRHVLVDSVCPLLGLDSQTQQKLQNLPLIEYVENQPMISESGGTHIVNAARPSLSALQVLFWSNGYTLSINHTEYFQSIVPNVYPKHRYCVDFVQNDSFNLIDFDTSYQFKNKSVTSNFAMSEIQAVHRKQWSFESGVSEYFEQHARQHIPRYDEITDLCVNICKRQLPDLQSSILDVGCATGNTILKLKAAGFDNLVGVDASASMLAKVQHLDIAEWILSDQFPNQRAPYMAILCNWTLHFIKTKQNYLREIYQNLHAGGLLILTEKTANSGLELSLYHDFKRSQGVSEQDIKNKAESLEHVMFIDSVDWYISTLKELGFGDIKIIDASPCFTTFLAFKPR